MKTNFMLNTNGKGLWSSKKDEVECTSMVLRRLWNEEFAELKVYFTKDSWNPNKDGLIYTDPFWLKEFKEYLTILGFSKKAIKEVDYSEQGMQGDDYVSLDVGKHFIKEYNVK